MDSCLQFIRVPKTKYYRVVVGNKECIEGKFFERFKLKYNKEFMCDDGFKKRCEDGKS